MDKILLVTSKEKSTRMLMRSPFTDKLLEDFDVHYTCPLNCYIEREFENKSLIYCDPKTMQEKTLPELAELQSL